MAPRSDAIEKYAMLDTVNTITGNFTIKPWPRPLSTEDYIQTNRDTRQMAG